MANAIRIALDASIYAVPTDEDIRAAKAFVIRRNANATALANIIDERLQDASRRITQICYKYQIPPEQFQYSANKDMQAEVYAVLDELEADIYELIETYSLKVTNDEEHRTRLLPWIVALHSKGAESLRDTLVIRIRQWAYDLEAQIAAVRLFGYKQAKAISTIISTRHAVYSSPEVLAAYKKPSAAMYIKSKGIHYGGQGLSSSGSVNVENFGKLTASMAWMRYQLQHMEEDNAVGYWQERGSTIPCAICDEEVGLHLGSFNDDPLPHAHCMCYRVPIYEREYKEIINENLI